MNLLIHKWLFTAIAIQASTNPFLGIETAAEAEARRDLIAEVIEEVAFDPQQKPLFYHRLARTETAAWLYAVAKHESRFARSVFEGTVRGDNGRSWCLTMQNLGQLGKTAEGWYGRELVAPKDSMRPENLEKTKEATKKCFVAALNGMRKSFNECQSLGLPKDQWLRGYASGSCNRPVYNKQGKQIGYAGDKGSAEVAQLAAGIWWTVKWQTDPVISVQVSQPTGETSGTE